MKNKKIKLSELRSLVREELTKAIVEFETKEMPAGASWRVAGTGWAAKNANGVANYWYGKDSNKNKENADKWAKDSSKKPEDI